MADKIKKSYKQTRNIYDDVLTRSKWWSRLYMNIFWGGCDDNEIARKVLAYIPDDFKGPSREVYDFFIVVKRESVLTVTK